MDKERHVMVCTVNMQHVYLYYNDPEFRRALQAFRCVIDGQVLKFFKTFLGLKGAVERISGSDLVFELESLLTDATKARVFILGGSTEANASAVDTIKSRYGCSVVGFAPGLIDERKSDAKNREIRELIEQFRPSFLLICFGCPKQEFWLWENRAWLSGLGCELIYGGGGTVDFLAGTVKRSPQWVSEAGLESLYRLYQEPGMKRLKRIAVSIVAILNLILKGTVSTP